MSAYDWREQAKCAGADLRLFFGADGETRHDQVVRERKAKAVCAGCPVRLPCGTHAVTRPEPWGTWGGLGEAERYQLRRKWLRLQRAAA